MSVPKSRRTIPKCDAILKAKAVLDHTLKVTQNDRLFTIMAFNFDINHEAERIYIHAYSANNVYVTDAETKSEREYHQRESILSCKNLLALIDFAWHYYHLDGKKVSYWSNLVLEARKSLINWYKSDKERYKNLNG